MPRGLKIIRIVFFIVGITISILTSVMSYDAGRIGIDAAQTAQSIRVDEEGGVTAATLDVNIRNNGYIFSLKDADLVVGVYDEERGSLLGTSSERFTVDPGDEFSGEVRIRMRTEEYQRAVRINVTVTVDGGLAAKLPDSRITFVTFTLVSSEATAK